MFVKNDLESLNGAQHKAVTASPGCLLILAGAGSGKTRVLVNRIAWLISQTHCSSNQIFAVTFTNKAAQEMKSRLEHLLNQRLGGMWVGTFHGLAHKLLRLHYDAAALPDNFQVIDSEDQLRLIRRIYQQLSINEEQWEPQKAQSYINLKKDDGIRARQIPPPGNSYERVMREVYVKYESLCEHNGVVDFAELLLRSFELLKKSPELLTHYQNRFNHFLVDEFQDTNTIQYEWLKLLNGTIRPITIVGDDDQSIYGWRGAKVENLNRFLKDFPSAHVLRLEQNYRSTHVILTAANTLIQNNDARLGKTLWTKGEKGSPITLYAAYNESDEALFVIRQIRAWVEKGGAYQDIGILYRSNSQSRILEEALVRARIPYIVYGGLRFFERSEIKDALAYLRLIGNHKDNTAFDRAINTPPRGIGHRTLDKIRSLATDQNLSYWEATELAIEDQLITGKARIGLVGFIELITRWENEFKNTSLSDIIAEVIKTSGLLQYFKTQRNEKAQGRAENLEELVNATADFSTDSLEDESQNLSPINAFLSHTTLESGDLVQKEANRSVQLMTLHSAKGLEFPMVIMCGVEEGLFPHYLSKDNPNSLAEERRLCYVGITRAMKQLFITHAEKRRLFGRDESRLPSRFINELPKEHLVEEAHRISVTRPYPFVMPISQPQVIQTSSGTLFSLGRKVSHTKFGTGTIIDFEGEGDKSRIHVHFDKSGSKWLVLAFAKLELL